MKYKEKFDELPWAEPAEGVRHKVFDQDGKRLRLVEYSRRMPEHWCEKGHWGIVLRGSLEIEFVSSREIYSEGDAVFLPNGAEHKHKARLISGTALIFFVEDI